MAAPADQRPANDARGLKSWRAALKNRLARPPIKTGANSMEGRLMQAFILMTAAAMIFLSGQAMGAGAKGADKGAGMENVKMGPFERGGANPYGKYFQGQSYLNMLSKSGVNIANVTFEPGCRNDWHIHHAKKDGGQILLCTYGRGWYQEWGKPARELHEGDVVMIPHGVKHWHGAAKDSWFAHLSVEVPGEEARTEWLEPVDRAGYDQLP